MDVYVAAVLALLTLSVKAHLGKETISTLHELNESDVPNICLMLINSCKMNCNECGDCYDNFVDCLEEVAMTSEYGTQVNYAVPEDPGKPVSAGGDAFTSPGDEENDKILDIPDGCVYIFEECMEKVAHSFVCYNFLFDCIEGSSFPQHRDITTKINEANNSSHAFDIISEMYDMEVPPHLRKDVSNTTKSTSATGKETKKAQKESDIIECIEIFSTCLENCQECFQCMKSFKECSGLKKVWSKIEEKLLAI